MNVEAILAKLEGVNRIGGDGKRWWARCPAHQGGNGLLLVSVDDNGQVGFDCQGGCRAETVAAALGLRPDGSGLDSGGGDVLDSGAGAAPVQGGHDCHCSRAGTGAALHELPDGALLDGPALALALGVSHRTIRRMIRRSELPPGVKLGAGKKWIASRVREWINARAESAEKEAAREAARLRAL